MHAHRFDRQLHGGVVVGEAFDRQGESDAHTFTRLQRDALEAAQFLDRTRDTGAVGETLRAAVQVAHFGPAPLTAAVIDWQLIDTAGVVIGAGELPAGTIAVSSQAIAGEIVCSLAAATPARKVTLVVGVAGADGMRYENDWDLWVFADDLALPEGGDVIITGDMDEALRQTAAGGSALLLLDPAQVKTASTLGFSSVFWNTAWTRGQAPHTLGILCDPTHPVFADFPTESHSNWQWWELIHGAAAMQIDALPPALRPLVQPIDTWFEARRLALLLEVRVGAGKLMLCAMDLASDLDQRLVARQMRHSVLRYMQSAAFQPMQPVSAQQLQGLVR